MAAPLLANNLQQHGYITLMAVIIFGAVATAITVSVLTLGLGSTHTVLIVEDSLFASYSAHTCAETALGELAKNNAFSGSALLSTPRGTCAYTVHPGSGGIRTITVSSTVKSIVRQLSITTSALTPALQLSSWQDITSY